MLPTYGNSYGGHGASKRRGDRVPIIASAVLAVLVLLTGWGMLSAKSQVALLNDKLSRLQSEIHQLESQSHMDRSGHQHVEAQYQAANRQLQDTTHALRVKEQELMNEKTEKASAEMDCVRRVNEQEDRIKFEKEVNEALQKHIRSLEEAHNNRETDWHELAKQWKQYETDAIQENHRLLVENQRLKHLEESTSFKDPALPVEEPKDRPEAHFDASFQVPKYHHDGSPVPQQQQQQQAPQQQQQQAPQQQQQAHAPGTSPPSQPSPVHDPAQQPSSHPPDMRHHDDIYAHHYEDWEHPREEHLDPLDQYWTHDGFADDHDNFHGEDWHAPERYDHYAGRSHDDHYQWQEPEHDSWEQQHQERGHEQHHDVGHGDQHQHQEHWDRGPHGTQQHGDIHGSQQHGDIHGHGHGNAHGGHGNWEHADPSSGQGHGQQQARGSWGHRPGPAPGGWHGSQRNPAQHGPAPYDPHAPGKQHRSHDDLNYKLGF